MRITVDPAKRDATLRERRIDFADAAAISADGVFTAPDLRFAYPEPRFTAYGMLKGRMGSDLAFIDAYENTAADDEEIPELTEDDFDRGWWEIGGVRVSEAEARAAMAAKLAARREPVQLDIPDDVIAAFRADGPDWRDRMTEALRKAVGL